MIVCDRCKKETETFKICLVDFDYAQEIKNNGQHVCSIGDKQPVIKEIDLCEDCLRLLSSYNNLFLNGKGEKYEMPI